MLATTWTLDDINGGATHPGDRFGQTLASGDFNGDGWQDLAIGAPQVTLPFTTTQNVGMVVILYGTGVGLRADASHRQYVWQLMNIDGTEADDFFGSTLAAGDFNGDGYDDLAVGTPNEDVSLGFLGNCFDAGSVNIYPGSATGLLTDEADSLYLRQGDLYTNVSNADAVEASDYFGRSLAAGDFNADGYQDLAIGVPGEDFGTNNQVSDAGMFHVIYGFNDFFQGIDATTTTHVSQNTFQVEDSSENGDNMGQSLASGDFDGDSYDDLAVGVPGENPDNVFAAGVVQVFPGSAAGLLAANDTLWSQASPGIAGFPESTDRFGRALASGDFDNDGYADLLIGVPNEDVGSLSNAGAVNVIYGSVLGLTSSNNQLFTQNSPGIAGIAEAGDSFGGQLAAGDINYDGYADALIGVPQEDSASNNNSGVTHTLPGSGQGLTTSGSGLYFPPADQTNGQFGGSLLVSDFGNGTEIAVGQPGYTSIDNEFEAGAVIVFPQTNPDIIFEDSFENKPDETACTNPASCGVFFGFCFRRLRVSATICDLDTSHNNTFPIITKATRGNHDQIALLSHCHAIGYPVHHHYGASQRRPETGQGLSLYLHRLSWHPVLYECLSQLSRTAAG